jgi:hypothetical protein
MPKLARVLKRLRAAVAAPTLRLHGLPRPPRKLVALRPRSVINHAFGGGGDVSDLRDCVTVTGWETRKAPQGGAFRPVTSSQFEV